MADRHTINFIGERHKGFRVGTLWCSCGSIDGDVTLSRDFDGWARIDQLDFLRDVIGLLQREYDFIARNEFDKLAQAPSDGT